MNPDSTTLSESATTVGNVVCQAQNSPIMLRRLYAQKALYSKAKRLVHVNLFLVAIVPLLLSIFAFLVDGFDPWVALYAAFVGVLDVIIVAHLVDNARLRAATVQEVFDCELLGLPWNPVLCGPRSEAERAIACVRAGPSPDEEHRFRDWYTQPVSGFPTDVVPLACQFINATYTKHLRHCYSQLLAGLATCIFFIPFVVGLFWWQCFGFTEQAGFDKWLLAVVAPSLPAVTWFLRERLAQSASAKDFTAMGDALRAEFEDASHEAGREHRARQYQDRIFTLRCTNPLVADFFYTLLRKRMERETSAEMSFLAAVHEKALKQAASGTSEAESTAGRQ